MTDWQKATKHMKTVELVVPCYNEGEMVPIFYKTASEIVNKIEGYSFSFIFINDGSRDNTLEEIRKLAAEHDDVKYISFSRNFGKEAGMYAGLKASTADRVTIIDADLQHPPELIEKMLYAIDVEGYDSCSARRISRDGEPKIRSFFSRMFYKVINKMSEVEIVDGAVDYRMMSRQMVDAIVSMPENHRFSKGIFCWVGFNTKWIEFKNVERVAGETTWSFWSLFRYAIEGIVAFTTFPLRLATITGSLSIFASFVYLIEEIIRSAVTGVGMWTFSVIVMLVLFMGGLITLSLGIMGEYIARIYTESKHRPIFIIGETNIKKKDGSGK